MKRCLYLAAVAHLLSGCAASPSMTTGRWQVVPVAKIIGYDDAGCILVDTQTGETWAQDFKRFEKPNNRHYQAVYWHKMPMSVPTSLPSDGQ